MSDNTALVVEDDPDISALLEQTLTLAGFAVRNAGRPATLDVTEDAGAQSHDRGFTFLDASIDDSTGRVTLLLGVPPDGSARRTFSVQDVRVLFAMTDGAGVDGCLLIEHDGGEAVLTLLRE